MKEILISQIDASGKRGKLLSNQLYVACVVVFFLFFAIGVVCLVDLFLNYSHETIWLMAISALVTVLISIFVIKEFSHRKQIKKWLNDAIVIKAKVSVTDYSSSQLMVGSTCRVVVDFCYDGTAVSFTSGKFSRLENFAGNLVKVAYSPTYKQIMFLKSETEIV